MDLRELNADMELVDTVETFWNRVEKEWLPVYCNKPTRQYSTEGFKSKSKRIDSIDARDCMIAIDAGIVKHIGHGHYLAPLGWSLGEPLFWEGPSSTEPRPISLWLEPVITFAALARLHVIHEWPVELLANQPIGLNWAFDLAAHELQDTSKFHLLGEVKKSAKEADSLVADLLKCCAQGSTDEVRPNSAKKWTALTKAVPPILWIIGPAGYSRVFQCAYEQALSEIRETDGSALRFDNCQLSG